MKLLKWLWGGLVSLLLAAMLIFSAAFFVIPTALGGTSMTVLTGSMEPTINPGDLIAIRAATGDNVHVGSIVTFQPKSGDSTLVTHRIVGVTTNSKGKEWVTQGDNNSAKDKPIVSEQIKGVYMYRLPYVGNLLKMNHGQSGATVKYVAGGLILVAIIGFLIPSKDSGRVDDDSHSDGKRRA